MKGKNANGKLTARQQRFVEEYVKDLNATQAAIRAGYTGSNATIRVTACETLTKPNVLDALRVLKEKRSRENAVTQERIKEELARIGFSNMDEFAEWSENGVKLKNSDTLPTDAKRCVQEVSEVRTKVGGLYQTTLKFKLHDKVKALDMLARHVGMYAEADGRAQAIGAIGVEMFRKMMEDAAQPGAPSINVTPAYIVDGRNGNNGSGA